MIYREFCKQKVIKSGMYCRSTMYENKKSAFNGAVYALPAIYFWAGK